MHEVRLILQWKRGCEITVVQTAAVTVLYDQSYLNLLPPTTKLLDDMNNLVFGSNSDSFCALKPRVLCSIFFWFTFSCTNHRQSLIVFIYSPSSSSITPSFRLNTGWNVFFMEKYPPRHILQCGSPPDCPQKLPDHFCRSVFRVLFFWIRQILNG